MGKSTFKEVEVLANLNNGAIEELFAPELQKVLNNLGDSNTGWKAAREINIKVKIRLTNESRDNAVTEVSVVSKVAPSKAHESNIYLEQTGGDVLALFKEVEVQPDLDNIHPINKEM